MLFFCPRYVQERNQLKENRLQNTYTTVTATRIRKEAPSRSILSTGPIAEASALDVGVVEGAPHVKPKSDLAISPAWSRVVKEGRR